MLSGLYGMMVIEGSETDIRSIPEIGAAKEVLMMYEQKCSAGMV